MESECEQLSAPQDASVFSPEQEERRGAASALSLRVVALSQVHPHEMFHDARVERLAERLAQEGVLLNPPIVARVNAAGAANNPDEPSYVVLDGATRVNAFRKLAHPHIIVQVVDVERDNVQLFAWNHVVRDVHGSGGVTGFLQMVESVEGLHLYEIAAESVPHIENAGDALGTVRTVGGPAYALQLDAERGRAAKHDAPPDLQQPQEILNRLVDAYGQWGDIERTLSVEMEQVRTLYRDAVALILFPTFTPSSVLQMAARGHLLPAGITRFVIPGRILRLNAPLEPLTSGESTARKQEWLDRFVAEKLGNRHVRYYEEPVMLLDE